MQSIEIDFEVFKALTAQRQSESTTYNDVLRNLLGLSKRPANDLAMRPTSAGQGDWICKGVRFPEGTDFRAQYKGQMFYARVERGGLYLDGRLMRNPSVAATTITKNSVNGWIFWECRFPGEAIWRLLKSLRKGG